MNMRKLLAGIALVVGCSTGYAQSQGFVQNLLNATGLGNVGAALGAPGREQNQNALLAENSMELMIRQGMSPQDACAKASSDSLFAAYKSGQCLSDAQAYEKSLEPARRDLDERVKQAANANLKNEGETPSQACSNAIAGNSTKFLAPGYTQAQCERDMTVVASQSAQAAPEHGMQQEDRPQDAQSDFNKAYSLAVERAVQTSLAAGEIDFACDNALRDTIGSTPSEQNDATIERCVKDMRPIYYQPVRAASFKPLNCAQWAIKKGDTWQNAQQGMQYKPLATSTDPVTFSGEIQDAEEAQLTVVNEDQQAYIDVNASTQVFNRDKIAVGANTSGYGVVSGRQGVQLVSGAAKTIPVIKAACIE